MCVYVYACDDDSCVSLSRHERERKKKREIELEREIERRIWRRKKEKNKDDQDSKEEGPLARWKIYQICPGMQRTVDTTKSE